MAALKLLRYGVTSPDAGIATLEPWRGLSYHVLAVYPHFIVASADPWSAVHEYADDYLHRWHPNLEDPTIVTKLFALYLGRPPSASGARDGRGGVGISTKMKILAALVKSSYATSQIPCIKAPSM